MQAWATRWAARGPVTQSRELACARCRAGLQAEQAVLACEAFFFLFNHLSLGLNNNFFMECFLKGVFKHYIKATENPNHHVS